MGANEKYEAAMHRGFDPVTESVCERFMHDRYMTDGVNTDQSRAEFDRWLETVKAEAWDEGAMASESLSCENPPCGVCEHCGTPLGNPYRREP